MCKKGIIFTLFYTLLFDCYTKNRYTCVTITNIYIKTHKVKAMIELSYYPVKTGLSCTECKTVIWIVVDNIEEEQILDIERFCNCRKRKDEKKELIKWASDNYKSIEIIITGDYGRAEQIEYRRKRRGRK